MPFKHHMEMNINQFHLPDFKQALFFLFLLTFVTNLLHPCSLVHDNILSIFLHFQHQMDSKVQICHLPMLGFQRCLDHTTSLTLSKEGTQFSFTLNSLITISDLVYIMPPLAYNLFCFFVTFTSFLDSDRFQKHNLAPSLSRFQVPYNCSPSPSPPRLPCIILFKQIRSNIRYDLFIISSNLSSTSNLIKKHIKSLSE